MCLLITQHVQLINDSLIIAIIIVNDLIFNRSRDSLIALLTYEQKRILLNNTLSNQRSSIRIGQSKRITHKYLAIGLFINTNNN
jgi:hypothetical protein